MGKREAVGLHVVPRESAKRLGRPPDTDSADTRRMILRIARETFSVLGYEVATNREIASRSGVTPGALYHYFGSKMDLYLAVHEYTQDLVYSRFSEAIVGRHTFVDQFTAVLDVAHEMNRTDHSVARFLGAVRVDVRRHPEMRVSVEPRSRQRERFFADMVEVGVSTGEISPQRRAVVFAYILTVLVGLTDAVSDDIDEQGRAIVGIKDALRGLLG
ncbi:MAG: TetR/AcrR family transcriptional regulator [Ilumatobacteraceae bacterium]|nr:TetR/AcrR family transcriptional regulator [Ilumatobacteraceae bacterium]